MPELELIGAAPSNYVWVCRIALAEKGVPYRLNEARPHTPEVDAIHPFGKIPVMRHGEITLCESRAICGYIDNAFEGPKLVPTDCAKAAQVEQWISVVNTHIDPTWVRQYLAAHFFPKGPDGTPDRAVIEAALPKMEQQFAAMDRAVATGHLVGDTFTLADINLMPILFYMSMKPESGALMQRMPALKAYYDRHMARKRAGDRAELAPRGASRAGGLSTAMPGAAAALAALADPTRRQIFERLAAGPRAVGEIARGLPVTRPAVSQHLAVLKSAGLVRDQAAGTRRIYEIDPKGLGTIRAWLDQFWDTALASFKNEVEGTKGQQ